MRVAASIARIVAGLDVVNKGTNSGLLLVLINKKEQ
jgi:hypothetical protein